MDLNQDEKSLGHLEGGLVGLCPFPLLLFFSSFSSSVGGTVIFVSLCLSSQFCLVEMALKPYYAQRSHWSKSHQEECRKVIVQFNSCERETIGLILTLNHFCLLGVNPRPTPYPVCPEGARASWFPSWEWVCWGGSRGWAAIPEASSVSRSWGCQVAELEWEVHGLYILPHCMSPQFKQIPV